MLTGAAGPARPGVERLVRGDADPAARAAAQRPRVLYVINDARFTTTHYQALAQSAARRGAEVEIAVPPAPEVETLRDAGFRVHDLPLDRRGMNPVTDLRLLVALRRLYRARRPVVVHHITLKPVLYGTLAALSAGVPRIVNSISGLGYLFGSSGPREAAVRAAVLAVYRRAFADDRVRLVFENPDDRQLFVGGGFVPPERTTLVLGAGVDETRFVVRPIPPGDPVVLLPARMLWDKGVGEFVAAARLLRARGVRARFVLAGGLDVNRAAVPEAQLRTWTDEGVVEWWGLRDDMPDVLAQATLVVLPSYREGCPKALLEAAACGRAIVTCDVPGCREAVRPGENGLLVPARDAHALGDAVERLLADADLRAAMGRAGRVRAEREFAADRVTADVLGAYTPFVSSDAAATPA